MRGKAFPVYSARAVLRITPAYAGKSTDTKLLHRVAEDHPRLCGEKKFFHFLYSSVIGSPPPMRGKATFAGCKGYKPGITPAYAGKSTLTEGWAAGT